MKCTDNAEWIEDNSVRKNVDRDMKKKYKTKGADPERKG